jgi:hypothetical protein
MTLHKEFLLDTRLSLTTEQFFLHRQVNFCSLVESAPMTAEPPTCHKHDCYPSNIISHCVWWYF